MIIMKLKDVITGTISVDYNTEDDGISIALNYGGSIPVSSLFKNYDGEKIKITIEKADD